VCYHGRKIISRRIPIYSLSSQCLGRNGKTKIKEQFQKIYQANDYAIFETFWQNEGLRGTLFPEKSEAQAKADFINYSTNLNSNLYYFINVE
jgi:hypothetical protein